MIKKELITIQSEAWFDEDKGHRYVFRRQWSTNPSNSKKESLAAVVTIRPGGTSAYVEDLTMLLVEKNIRKLGFDGFIAVNLFSSVKSGTKYGTDKNTLEVISTVLKDKQIDQVIFACGSVLGTNQLAGKQAKDIYEQLSSKQQTQAKVLIDPSTKKFAHPLNCLVRKEWICESLTKEDLSRLVR
ncbi:DUF1643 domain-containing protein [Enterococcus sp. 22-H-5-01]|uniref:DUF1643 domain-containing protein n=1 Tax=Enterococcus sp. 22-H-5-01 TaxID=3418555 RepID=UPI003D011709